MKKSVKKSTKPTTTKTKAAKKSAPVVATFDRRAAALKAWVTIRANRKAAAKLAKAA